MAKDDKGNSSEIALNPLIDRILKGETFAPRLTILVGYAGKAAQDDHIRIYRSLHLDSFVDVPKAHVRTAHTPENPLEAAVFWVESDAPVSQKTAASAASFLQGDIANQHLAGAAPSQPTPAFGAQFPTIACGGFPRSFGGLCPVPRVFTHSCAGCDTGI